MVRADGKDEGNRGPNQLNSNGTTFIITGNGTYTYTLSGVLHGSGNLIKAGSGTMVLGNTDNKYTGGTIVNEGVLQIANWNSINPDSLLNAVSGYGSELRSMGSLRIGYVDAGALEITAGAKATAEGDIYLGVLYGSSGTVTVSGDGSTLSATGNNSSLFVGYDGDGALYVTDGAKATAEGDIYLGYYGSSTVTVSGVGSELRAGGDIHVGRDNAYATSLLAGTGTVVANSRASAENGTVVANHSASAGTVFVYNSGVLSAGDTAGQIGTLTIGTKTEKTNLTLYSGSTLRVDTGKNDQADLIEVYGDVTFGYVAVRDSTQSSFNIVLGSLNNVTEAPILTVYGNLNTNFLDDTTFTLNGVDIDTLLSLGRVESFDASVSNKGNEDNEGNSLLLSVKAVAQSKIMYWTGNHGKSWDMTTHNWKDTDDSASTFLTGERKDGSASTFLVGDWVVFDAPATSDNTVDSVGVTVSQMDVTNGTWIFNGDITARADSWVDATDSSEGTPNGALNISGAYTDVILTGNNYFDGGINMADQSTLTVSGRLGSEDYGKNISLSDNASLILHQPSPQTLSGDISGTGSLTKNGDNVLTLSGVNIYSGNTIVNGGTLRAGAENAFSASSVHYLYNTAVLDLNGTDQTIGGLSGGSETIVNIGDGALTINQTDDPYTYAGVFSGTGNITKSGDGQLYLSGDSSGYTGTFTQSEGGVTLKTNAKLGGTFTQEAGEFSSADGATLEKAIFKGTVLPTGALYIADAVFDEATVEFTLANNSLILVNNVSFTDITLDINLTDAEDDTYTLIDYNFIFGESNVTVNVSDSDGKRGGYYFDTTDTALIYEVFSGSTSLTWAGTSDAHIWDNDVSANNIWATEKFNTWFKNGDEVTFDAGAAYTSVVVADDGVTAGNMNIYGGYNFSGGTITAEKVTVADGAVLGLVLGSEAALTAASVDFNNSGGLNITGYTPDENSSGSTSATATYIIITTTDEYGVSNFNSESVTVAEQPEADFLAVTASLINNDKDIAVETALSWNLGNSRAHGNFTIDEGATFTLGATLEDETANADWDGNTLTKKGGGALILSGENAYTGGTLLNEGRIEVQNAQALGSAGLTMADNTALGFAADSITLDNSITLTGTGTVDTGAHDAELSGALSGQGALTKTGTGLLTLSGENAYSGLTTVQSGILELGSDLTASSGLTLYSGTTFRTAGNTHDLGGKTLTVWDNAAYDGDLNAQGATLNFITSSDTNSGSILNVAGNADIADSFVNLGTSGSASLSEGDTLSLLKTTGTLSAAGISQGDGTSALRAGATLVYDITLITLSDELRATIGSGAATKESKALSEGFLSGMALTLEGANLIANQGMNLAVRAAQHGAGAEPGGYRLGGFAATSGGSLRYNTGSHIDMQSFSIMTGLAFSAESSLGLLTLGAFFEYGNGSYDTHNSFSNAASVSGDGSTWYTGGGLLGRMDFIETGPGHIYTEASARAGRAHNEYDNSDLRDSLGRRVEYESSSNYYGLHLGAGYIWNLTDKADLDLYAKYFWTRQEGDSVSLSTGESVRFKDMDSHRTRLGSRLSYEVNEYFTPYVGAAWEREFDSKAKGTVNGYGIDAPKLKGDTGIGELGVSVKFSQTLPLFFDLGVQGYTGKREGVTGSLQARFEF